MCADLLAHFLYALGEANSYFPANAEHTSDGMYHAKTPDHNKEVILKSMQDRSGVVRVVFCTVALGMGFNFAGLNYIIHYGAPRSIEDYIQECGRAGRSCEPAKSVIYWTPVEAPLRKKLVNPCDAEIAAVRRYLKNVSECRRRQLLSHFDSSFCSYLQLQDHLLCCDVC
jgi:superfamily II DNA helicase RecQ